MDDKDWRTTIGLVKREGGKVKKDKYSESWLGHRANSQAAFIDWLVLEEKYTLDDMVGMIINDKNPSICRNHTRINWDKVKRRIEQHFRHLTDDPDPGKIAHQCKLIGWKDNGVVRFDVK